MTTDPVARAEMLIRKPVSEVFDAFIDPAITSKFWFSRGDGRLEAGATLKWYWDMYAVTAEVVVKSIERNHRILINWPTPVEWIFIPRGDGATLVSITASGFVGTDDEKVGQAIDSMGGFSLVLAGCKAFLERGVMLNLVADRKPDAHVEGRA